MNIVKILGMSLLAATALGGISIGSATALPLGNTPPQNDGAAQNARLVCDQFGRCYNTRRHRGARHHRYHEQHYGYRGYDDGYYRSQRSYGFGPFGIFTH